MAKKQEIWIEAKKKCRLNNEDIKMAKELGLNPKSLIKNIPSKNERWKAPVKIWIREMYEKRYGVKKTNNDNVINLRDAETKNYISFVCQNKNNQICKFLSHDKKILPLKLFVLVDL